ncbi:MAG TPA: FlgD immunoglobulin-like domain containing protein [Candidatus Deferrimicrobium sp.]|nr:FlgD immunoglobulin-like domain containing protein [Candidatus Deferrimicrobium sp.]
MKKLFVWLFGLLLVMSFQAVQAVDCVDVDIELPDTVVAAPGSYAEGSFELVNCGDEDAVVTLSVTIDINSNPFTVANIPVRMAAGEVISREFRLPVPPPAAGKTVSVCVTATSGTAQNDVCATVTIVGPAPVAGGSKTITFLMAAASECVDISLELPDTVKTGSNEEGYFELTNCGDEAATINLDVSIDTPDTAFSLTGLPVRLGAGETISKNFRFPIPPIVPSGEYVLCVTATSGQAVATSCQTVIVEGGGGGIPFQACGILVQRVNCVLFAPFGQPLWVALDNYGAFLPGDSVCVSGELVINCQTTCVGALACVENVTISPWHFPKAAIGNYPNPFNPSTTISFELPVAGHVRLTIYNSLGQQVRTLVNEKMGAGGHLIEWDGTDDLGSRLASGAYFYRLEAGDVVERKTMLMIK